MAVKKTPTTPPKKPAPKRPASTAKPTPKLTPKGQPAPAGRRGGTLSNAGVGRRRGVPNKTTRLVKEAVLLAAEGIGEDGKGRGKLIGFFKKVGRESPIDLAKIVAKLIPIQITGDGTVPFAIYLSPDDGKVG